MVWDTAAAIINDAALELGIGASGTLQPAGADPWVSSDPNILKLISYLKSGGREIVAEREWSHLRKEYSFNTIAAQEAYPLPPDFRNLILDSGWDRSSRFPLGGPLDGDEWQYIKAINSGALLKLYVRIKQGQFYVFGGTAGAQVPANHQIVYEYSSLWFAGAANAQLPAGLTKEFPTANTDVVFLESNLMSRRLMHDFARKNGMGDMFAADYKAALEKGQNSDSAARKLRLGGGRAKSDLISTNNLPVTGFGS